MGWLKDTWNGVRDVARGVAYVVVAPVNSFTGHTYNPNYQTGVGGSIGEVLENSIDNVHVFFKTWADKIFAGLPTKFANLFRDKENREEPGHYTESKNYAWGVLDFLNDFSGALAGNSSAGQPPPEPPQDAAEFWTRYAPLIKVLAIVAGVLLLFGFITKK